MRATLALALDTTLDASAVYTAIQSPDESLRSAELAATTAALAAAGVIDADATVDDLLAWMDSVGVHIDQDTGTADVTLDGLVTLLGTVTAGVGLLVADLTARVAALETSAP